MKLKLALAGAAFASLAACGSAPDPQQDIYTNGTTGLTARVLENESINNFMEPITVVVIENRDEEEIASAAYRRGLFTPVSYADAQQMAQEIVASGAVPNRFFNHTLSCDNGARSAFVTEFMSPLSVQFTVNGQHLTTLVNNPAAGEELVSAHCITGALPAVLHNRR